MPLLKVHAIEERGTGLVRRICRASDGSSVFWDIRAPDDLLPGTLHTLDFAAAAFVFKAMAAGADLHICGRVSRAMLENMERFIGAWRCWLPDTYKSIKVSAEEEAESPPLSTDAAVAAFSGGIDASFTLLRHVTGTAGRTSRRPSAAILIHGFDIPLSKPGAFAHATQSASRMLQSIKVPVATVRTNWRDAICREWQMEFGAGLAACLHHWSGKAGVGLIGSDEDYAHLVLPWGSNPITIPLLSGAGFELRHDGAEFTRTGKVAALVDWREFVENLRVCWEGPATGRNCGRCEKCVRTKLNFMALQRPVPTVLGDPVGESEIAALKVRNAVQLAYLADILEVAEKNAIDSAWVGGLRRRVIHADSSLKMRRFVGDTAKGIPLVAGGIKVAARARRLARTWLRP